MGSPITNDLKIILSRYSFHSQFWEVSLVSTCPIDRSFGKMIKLNRLRASKHCFNNTYHLQSLLCNFTPWTPFTCFPPSKSNHRSLTIRGLGRRGCADSIFCPSFTILSLKTSEFVSSVKTSVQNWFSWLSALPKKEYAYYDVRKWIFSFPVSTFFCHCRGQP